MRRGSIKLLHFKNKTDDYRYNNSKRPFASLWNQPEGPWKNAFHGLQNENHLSFIQIVRALAEGNGIRGISRIFEIDKNTALNYLKKAAYQCRRVTNYFLKDLHVEELQLDEMWSFVYKKEKNLTEEEYATYLEGDQWCWIAKDVQTQVIVQYELGKRTYQLAYDFILLSFIIKESRKFRFISSNCIELQFAIISLTFFPKKFSCQEIISRIHHFP